MKAYIINLFVTLIGIASQQIPDWNKTTNWNLYDTGGKKNLSMPLDSVLLCKSVPLPSDSMHVFLNQLYPWPKGKQYPVWMGAFCGTYEINSIPHKVDISMYGGFMYDENTRSYFQLPETIRNEWMDFLNKHSEEFYNSK